jgi:PAS domain-containing protein
MTATGRIRSRVNGRVILVNREAEAVFGLGRVELLGRGVEELVPERFRARDRERLAYELYDTVIARLFAAGLGAPSLLARIDDSDRRTRVTMIDELDWTNREVRRVAFGPRST